MKKTQKYLSFELLKIELTQTHPKDVSRALFCLKDQQNAHTYKTQKYGEVQPQTIEWQNQSIEILYTNQQMMRFQTICEHEYGYQIDELEALYSGQIYIKTENFFRNMTVHVFDAQGHKCGVLRYMIKVIEKELTPTAKKVQKKEEAIVKVQLNGKITLFAASVTITNIAFKKQRYSQDLALTIEICGEKHTANYKKNYEWSFSAPKIQYTDKSPTDINISLTQADHLVLSAHSTIHQIKENKRFVTHSFPVYDPHDTKMGTLVIDLRYITKQELLDLMYSPTKLAKNQDKHDKKMGISASHDNLEKSFHKNSMKHSRVNSSLMGSKPAKKAQELKHILNRSYADLEQPEARHADRYRRVYMINGNNEMIIPKAKRFTDRIASNPYVSYSDPAKFSDFSPSHWSRGPNISTSKKTDFTRQYKYNPGVGAYKLPSIWDKY